MFSGIDIEDIFSKYIQDKKQHLKRKKEHQA
jgi:hypothetical protein